MSLDDKQPESFLTIGLEILDLECRQKNGSSKFTSGHFAYLDDLIKSAKARQITAPRRSQDEINADIATCAAEHATLAANRTPIIGPRLTADE